MPNCQTLRLRFPRYRGYRTGPKRWDDHNQKSTKKLRKSRSWDLHWRVLLNSPATRRERVMSHRWVISCRCVHQSREPVVSSAQAVMRERESETKTHEASLGSLGEGSRAWAVHCAWLCGLRPTGCPILSSLPRPSSREGLCNPILGRVHWFLTFPFFS